MGDWNEVARGAMELGQTLEKAWQTGVLFPSVPSPPSVQQACDHWCGLICAEPRRCLEVPAELRPLILGRLAAATLGARLIAQQPECPAPENELGALRYLLIDYWREQVLPRWDRLNEDFFPG